MTAPISACANCGHALEGEYCSQCGQHAIDLHRPIATLVSDLVGDVLNLDTRLIRTLRPLLFTPGQVAKDYIAGRRAAHVPPLKSYLIAALIFFSLFTLFPSRARVAVFEEGSPEEAAAKSRRGTQQTFSLPRHIGVYDDWYQVAKARAMERPDEFAVMFYENVPRAFFLLLPVFALFLELLYRKQGFVIDHLAFSFYYHAFVFLNFSLFFLVSRAGPVLPGAARAAIGLVLLVWLVSYLPIALRRVYGGSRWMTGIKLVALAVLYLFAFFFSLWVIIGIALIRSSLAGTA